MNGEDVGEQMSEDESRQARRARGVVHSARMQKTITVDVTRTLEHPRYGKHMQRSSRFMVHDPHNTAREGDVVEIESTRPLSRHKNWRLVRIIRRAPTSEAGAEAPVQQ